MKKRKILIVEDERLVAEDIKASARKLGFSVLAVVGSGEDAVKKAENLRPDLVLMDIFLDGHMDGIEAASVIRSRFDIPVVYLTAHADELTLERAKVTDPFGYLLKPFEERDLDATIEVALYKHRMERMLKEKEEKIRRNLEETIKALALAVEMRDPFTSGHQKRVTNLACAIAQERSLAQEEGDGLRLACLVHDVGKIQVPAEILVKPEHLSEAEFFMVKMHPQIGYDILKSIDFEYPVAQVVLQHHERMDGSGYPGGLVGGEILLGARILAVADVIEAMSSRRSHRPALGLPIALEEIAKYKGLLYDSEIVEACLRLFYEINFSFE